MGVSVSEWTDSAFLLQVCDSDTVLDPACTIEMLRVLEEDPQVGGVGGDVQVRSNRGFLGVEGLDSASSSNWIYWGSVHFVFEGGFLFDSFIGIEGLICYPTPFLFYLPLEGGRAENKWYEESLCCWEGHSVLRPSILEGASFLAGGAASTSKVRPPEKHFLMGHDTEELCAVV